MQQEPKFTKQLFDTNFEHFITRKVAKVFYIIWIVLLAAFSALAVVAGLFSLFTGQARGFELLILVAAPLVSFLLLIIIRLAFETSIALVLIAENTRAQLGDRQASIGSSGGDKRDLPKWPRQDSSTRDSGVDEEDLPDEPKFD
jgi:hypothetical protein